VNKVKVRKAIIPAAGLGTSFLPETKAMPKEMLPIVDGQTIQRNQLLDYLSSVLDKELIRK
jgi:UTP-glucose-1-phosphate uridylyltransferase